MSPHLLCLAPTLLDTSLSRIGCLPQLLGVRSRLSAQLQKERLRHCSVREISGDVVAVRARPLQRGRTLDFNGEGDN